MAQFQVHDADDVPYVKNDGMAAAVGDFTYVAIRVKEVRAVRFLFVLMTHSTANLWSWVQSS